MPRYGLLMGLAIFAMWAVFLATGQVPELTAAPLRTLGHLAAEFLTGAVLIMGGAALCLRRDWGMPLTFAGFGLLLYALAQAIGYWLQLGNLALAALFVALLAPAPLLLLRRRPDRRGWLIVLLGSMLYATVQTCGYFAQQGEVMAVAMFALLLLAVSATLVVWVATLARIPKTATPGGTDQPGAVGVRRA